MWTSLSESTNTWSGVALPEPVVYRHYASSQRRLCESGMDRYAQFTGGVSAWSQEARGSAAWSSLSKAASAWSEISKSASEVWVIA